MKKGHGSKFPAKWEKTIAALLTGVSLADAAAEVKVSVRTLKGWLTDRDFATEYARARAAVLERTVTRVLALSGKVLYALALNLDAKTATARNTAAVAILDRAMKGVELLDLAARVE